ncbi:G protein-coupled glucose receptor regulating Gpa2-domain-containing protein [Corynascus novoguineensis]|uniref:G protein-coupled glucose receptor regulating Gpa2-domain-containing protein n=1 Tax=Corynascus novoguineensis TaxID=1126955 RepID=A0AAN7D2I7_9PEZI|nr:G protein-coupled glucose receptor regulating Gpa2-domain-containing protein [Corynascus novoguineensis]
MTIPRWVSQGMRLPFFSDGVAHPEETQFIAARDASSRGGDPHILRILLILSSTFASISVLSTWFALYWLILLLVKGDFVKSIVLLVYAIVSFAQGKVPRSSTFCQISGFALAVGIEASDIAVLLIALHSVMYILRPRSGLYPYRQFAYLAFYVLPVLAACLTFIAGNGYEDMGPYCYLRTDRPWARLALSWVPRYAICTSIVLIYFFIYFYIRRKMGDYGRRHSEATQSQGPRRSAGAISMPRLRYHGLIPSPPGSRRTSATDTILSVKEQLRPRSSADTTRPVSARTSAEVQAKGPVRWNWPVFTHDQFWGSSRSSADDIHEPNSPSSSPTHLIPPPSTYNPRRNTIPTDHAFPGPCLGSSSNSNINRRISSPPSLSLPTANDTRSEIGIDSPESSPMLPRQTTPSPPPSPFMITITPADSDPNPDQDQDQDPDPDPDPIHSKQLNNKRTLRQLHALFVYPLAYIIVWLFPFVSHVMGYDNHSVLSHYDNHNDGHRGAYLDGSRDEPPYWLLIVSVISLCVQGAVDCALFLLREKPWRHVAAGAKGGFWAALGRRWGWNLRRATSWCCGGRGGLWWGWKGGAPRDGVGRTREEMLVDGRLARERREEEVAVERERRRGIRMDSFSSPNGSRGGDRGTINRVREWWDVYIEREGVLDESHDGVHDDRGRWVEASAGGGVMR